MMEQRAPKIQSEVVYQRKKKTIHDGIEGTKDLVRSRISKKEKDNQMEQRHQRSSQKSYIKERKRQYMMEQRAPKIQSEVVYQRKKKTIHDGIEGTKDLVRSRISKKEKDKT